MSGRVLGQSEVRDSEGFAWGMRAVEWSDGSLTVEVETPNDPDHEWYGSKGPRFLAHDLSEALDALGLRW